MLAILDFDAANIRIQVFMSGVQFRMKFNITGNIV